MMVLLVIILLLIIYIVFLHTKIRSLNSKTLDITKDYNKFMHEYVALVSIDLEEDTYNCLKISKEVSVFLQSVNTQANFQLQTVMKNVAAETSREEILKFVDLSTLEMRLGENNLISFDFQGKFNGWCRAFFLWDNKKEKTVIFMIRMIENDKAIENQLRFRVENDSLTGLKNEEYGLIELNKKIANKIPGMFCLIEVDHFKELNDLYGNVVGNQIIVEVATSLKECFKEGDILIRRGGARFEVYSVDVQDREDGRFIMKLIENRIKEISITDVSVTISAGVAFNRVDSTNDVNTLITNAEVCLKTSREIEGVSVSYYD